MTALILGIALIQQMLPNPTNSAMEWFYPGDQRVLASALNTMNLVAIVRPVERQYGTRRAYRDLNGDQQMPSAITGVDTFEVVSVGIGSAGRTIKSLFLHTEFPHDANPFLPPARSLEDSNYLFVGLMQSEGRVMIPNLSRDPDDPNARRWWTAAQSDDEVGGGILLPTRETTVEVCGSVLETVIVNAAKGLRGASDFGARRITAFLTSFKLDFPQWYGPRPKPANANPEWEREERRRRELERILVQQAAPTVRNALPTLHPYGKVRAAGVLAVWGLSGATQTLIDAIIEADEAGVQREDAVFTNATLEGPRAGGPTSNELTDIIVRLRIPRFKSFLALNLLDKPDHNRVLALVRQLEIEDMGLRYALLTKFATWAGRDDLKPRMVNGRIDREQELIEYWRNNPPRVT
ncbi:MAG: hypothetical protein KatS3mg015_0046 [Fimbriimonadales bacterium]|nr:MAG: hypothetical protein KatS3mg015_0046 [Fimbriimonadales bacterium]